jgi:hypothetical protein
MYHIGRNYARGGEGGVEILGANIDRVHRGRHRRRRGSVHDGAHLMELGGDCDRGQLGHSGCERERIGTVTDDPSDVFIRIYPLYILDKR